MVTRFAEALAFVRFGPVQGNVTVFMTPEQRRDRQKKVRNTIFWIGTGVSLLAAVFLPLVIKLDSVMTVISVLGSWTFFTVLSLYTGQRLLETELAERHEDLLAAINATDTLKVALNDIREKAPHSLQVIAETRVDLLRKWLKKAQSGEWEIGDDGRLAIPLKLAQEVKRTLDTTAFFEHDPTTSDYHDLLAKAIRERSVTVRRLFLIKPGTDQEKTFEARVRKDLNARVEVRYRLIDCWIGSAIALTPRDFGIWDKELVWIYSSNPEERREDMHPLLLHGEVDLFQDIFELNWGQATIPPSEWFPPTPPPTGKGQRPHKELQSCASASSATSA